MRVQRGCDSPPLVAMVERLIIQVGKQPGFTTQSTHRLSNLITRFSEFAISQGIGDLDEVTAEHARAFVCARTFEGETPSVATRHLRRSAVRLLFRTARLAGRAHHDPTLDLRLPPRSSLNRRALADDEVVLCRSFALHTLFETRSPAVWALAEATARTSEIPRILPSNVDLESGLVWIHGGSKTDPRWGQLTEWGLERLGERHRTLSGDVPIVYHGKGSAESMQASSCTAVAQTLRRAGLAGEPDVGPSSIAAWAGARAFRDGASIDEVARMLGIRSLDRAARFIGWDWKQER
jgi:integrase